MRNAIIIVCFAIILIVFSCSNERGGFLSRLLSGGGSAVPVTVESVVGQDRTESTTRPASIDASEQVSVTIPEEATVDRISVAEGAPVTAGQEVAHLSEEEVNTKIARLRMDLQDAQNKADRNAYILKNRDRMLEEERIDKAQYDSAEAGREAGHGFLEVGVVRGQRQGPAVLLERLALLSPLLMDLGQPPDGGEILGGRRQHLFELGLCGLQFALFDEGTAQRDVGREVRRMVDEAGAARLDGLFDPARPAQCLGQLREGNRRRILFEPALEFVDAELFSHDSPCSLVVSPRERSTRRGRAPTFTPTPRPQLGSAQSANTTLMLAVTDTAWPAWSCP